MKVRDEETERSKLDSRFTPGIWLGRATESDEHIVGTAQGVYTARSIRAKNDQEIWNSGLIKSMKGTPWASGSSDASEISVTIWAKRQDARHAQAQEARNTMLHVLAGKMSGRTGPSRSPNA